MKVNLDVLKRLCTMKERKVQRYINKVVPSIDDYGAFMWKQKEGVKILAVAHMDVIFEDSEFRSIKTNNDIIVLSPTLDDRLGIFTILNLLPQYGIEVDMLFTKDEERCMSTAEDFVRICDKDYNLIIEFDRMGTDVVMYDYECNVELKADLESVGFEIGRGTYSDIRELEGLGVSAFNMGIAYHFQHTERCCASLADLARQLEKLKLFHDQFSGKVYEHMPLDDPASTVQDDPYWFYRRDYSPAEDEYEAAVDESKDHWYPSEVDYFDNPQDFEDLDDPDNPMDDRDFLWDYGQVRRAQGFFHKTRDGKWKDC
jgi:hypothetical protein